MGNRSNINLVGNTTQGQNVGSGEGVYKGKSVGNILQYKSLSVTGTTMAITCDADNIYFSAATGGGGLSSSSNGLCDDGSTVCLGGALSQNTTITAGGNNLYITGMTFSCTEASIANYLCGALSWVVGSTQAGLGVVSGNCASCQAGMTFLCTNDGSGRHHIYDDIGFSGMSYLCDYSTIGSTHPRWIPDAAWVTGQTGGGGSGFTISNNGLCDNGTTTVGLGGTLSESTTINVNATCLLSICSTGGNDLRFYVGNVIYACYNSGSNIGSRFCMDQQSRTTLGYCLSSNFYGFFNCGSTCAELKRYAGVNDCSYVKLTSAGLTLSSTDAIYVNGLTGKTSETSVLYLNSAGFLTTGTTAGGGGLSASDNGLCDNGTTVGLGGTLANDTDISGDDHTHSISMSPLNFTLSAGTNINLCTYFGSSSINLNANSGVIDMCGCSSRMVIGAYGILPAGIYLPTLPEKTSETNVVYIDGDGQLLSGATAGGGSPGGATTNVQFNHNDSFSGTSAFTFTGSHVGVTGTITSSGDMTATDFVLSSDESLKTCICQYIPTPIDVSYREYEFCNKPGNQRYGVIAQELNQTQPELVRCDNDGVMSVSYIDLLVREVAYLKNKVEELEKKIG